MLMKTDIKRSIITEAVMEARPVEKNGGAVVVAGGEDDPFNYMRVNDMVATQGRLEEDTEKIFDGRNRLRGNNKQPQG